MLKYHSYNIVFQEIPGEVTLAINLSNCPNGCKGCHSPYLQQNIGNVLTENVLEQFIAKYRNSITCVCFMGGDNDPYNVQQLAEFIRKKIDGELKTAWYSGKSKLPEYIDLNNFNFIKLGPYVEALGALDSPTTNQRFYNIVNRKLIDKTTLFQKRMNKINGYK